MLRGWSTKDIIVEALSSNMCVQFTTDHDELSHIRQGKNNGEPTEEQHCRHKVGSERMDSHADQMGRTDVGSGRSGKPREYGVSPR